MLVTLLTLDAEYYDILSENFDNLRQRYRLIIKWKINFKISNKTGSELTYLTGRDM